MPGGRGDTLITHKPVDACLSLPIHDGPLHSVCSHLQTFSDKHRQTWPSTMPAFDVYSYIGVPRNVPLKNISKYALYLFI